MFEWAEQNGLFSVEDAAQAFPYPGNANAKCTLFSFGSIKTCTALGGGVAIVRDPTVRARVRHVLEGHPMQLTREYAAKVAKAAAFTAVLRPSIFRRAVDAASYAGIDYGDVITRAHLAGFQKRHFSRQSAEGRARPSWR